MFEKDSLFWFCALAGSGMFLIQFLLYFSGADADDVDDHSAQHFKWLSKQAVTGFLMMFGWVGLACKRELGYAPLASTGWAIGAGLVVMLITGLVFRGARKLRSPGSVFRLEEVIGKEATVYQRIPKEGVGKISLSLHDMTHEVDAISLNGEEIASFSPVRVVKKTDERTVAIVLIEPR